MSHPGKEEDEEQVNKEQGGEEAEGGTVAIVTSSLTYCIGGKNANLHRHPLGYATYNRPILTDSDALIMAIVLGL